MRWAPIAVLFGALFAVAQNTPPSATTADAERKKIRVEGAILSLNGEAVRKATVRLWGAAPQPGPLGTIYGESTDNEGKFVFQDVPPGRYTLEAQKGGFVTTRYGARSNTSPGTQLILTAGMELKDLVVKMTPQGVIAGKVLDQDGDPVAFAMVQLLRFAYARGRKQLQPTNVVSANDLGEYRVSNLAPGRYYVSASDSPAARVITQDRAGRPGGGQEGNITTYYPNGTDAASAAPINVAAGGEMRGIDIRLLRTKVYTVRGKAAYSSVMTGQIGFTRKVEGVDSLTNDGSFSQLRPDATFEFRGVAPGTYVLLVLQTTVNGNASANLAGRMEVTVADANIDGLVLPVGPGPEIMGTVQLEDGDIATLLKPATVPVFPARFTLTPNDNAGITLNTPNTQVKEDGTFKFDAVKTSKYFLNANSLPPGTYLKSARFGGQDVTHGPIDTTSGTGGILDLVLSSKAAEVAGSVQNDKGEAQAGVIVTMWPKTPDAGPMGGAKQVNTDQSGGFRFQGLAPGEYYVAAWEELEPGLAQSADFLSRFTSEASAIKLAEGGHETRDLKLVPSDKIGVEIAKLP